MRRSVPLLTSLLAIAVTTPMHAAGYCGQQQPGHTVGYPPNNAYSAGYAPVAGTAYAAGPTYTAGFAPTASTYVDPSAVARLQTNGSYQAQRPAYFDNPSVYTGASTYTGAAIYTGVPAAAYQSDYQSFRAPLTNSLRGNAMPTTIVTTAPATYAAAYDGSIPGQPLPVPVPTGAPPTAVPATTVAPIYAAPAPVYAAPPSQPSGCCLSRFCGRLFGTNYSTSYYRAPVTYYRPVTSTNPTTGAPFVVQRPCTSYVQQVQRTPYTSLQFGQHTPAPAANTCPTTPNSCGPTSCGPASCGPGSCGPAPYGYGGPTASNTPFGGIGQVGAAGTTGQVTNIPSTEPFSAPPVQPSLSPSQPGFTPNTSPLSGAPTLGPPGGGTDLAPVGQPRLESGSVPILPENEASAPPVEPVTPATEPSPSSWQLQNPGDSTALIRPRASAPANQGATTDQTQPTRRSILESDNFTRAEPIEAPTDYVAPYGRQTFQTPRTVPVTRQLPGSPSHRTYDVSDLTSVSTRVPTASSGSAMVTRSASSFVTQPPPKQRDTTWNPAWTAPR